MAGDTLNITVDAQGNAVAELKRVEAAMRANETALKKLTVEGVKSEGVFAKQRAELAAFGAKVKGLRGHLLAAGAAFTLTALAARKLFDMGKEGAAASDQFEVLTHRINDFGAVVGRVRIATAGMIPVKDIYDAAAAFDAFGLDIDQIDFALEQATKTAIRTGKNASDMVDSLATGVARMSAPILDNLGIQLKMSAVTARATIEHGKQAEALTDAEKKATLLNMALEQLSEANADVKLEQTVTAQLTRFEAKINDTVDAISRWIALGWSEVLGTDAAPLITLRKEIDGLIVDVTDFEERISGGVDPAVVGWVNTLDHLTMSQNNITAVTAQQSAALRELADKLRQMPESMRVDVWNSLQSSMAGIPPELRAMVADMAGIPGAIARVTEAVEKFRMVGPSAGEAWWSGQLAAIESGTLPTTKKKTKGGGGGGRSARVKAAEAEIAAALMRAEVLRATTERDALEVKTGQELAQLEAQRAQMVKDRVSAAKIGQWYEQRQLEIVNEESAALDKIVASEQKNEAAIKAQAKAQAALQVARDAAADRVQEVTALHEIDLGLAAARDPIERARLNLERAKWEAVSALRQLSDDENQALVQRAEIQNRVNLAQAQYNALLREASGIDWGAQLRGVSAATQGVSASLSMIPTQRATTGIKEVDQASAQLTQRWSVFTQQIGAISGAVGQSAKTWEQYAAGQKGVGQALAGTAGAVGTAAMAFIEDEETKAAVAAAMEYAYAAAAYAYGNIPAGIAHTVAAGMFTAIAAGAGPSSGGGGGGGSGGEGGPSGAEGGADRQVIVQFGAGVILGSPQDVQKAIGQAEHSAKNTGHNTGY